MKKVMLVDDEILIRENIRDCVNWEQEGFLYCGDAPDGEVALPLIEEWMPDILITDIKMPFMDGLELSSIVRKRMPDVKIIILSGHDEFSFARSALRIGVEEYCLKPVSAADLIEILRATSQKIDRERREKQRHAYTREKLLSDLCGGLISTADAVTYASGFSMQLIARFYAVVIRDLRYPDTAADPARTAMAEAMLDEIMGEHFSFQRSRMEKVYLLKGETVESLRTRLAALQTEGFAALEAAFSSPPGIGVGSIQDRLQNIHTSFLEAEQDKNLRRISFRDVEAVGKSANGNVVMERAKFLQFLKIGSPQKTADFLTQFATGLRCLDWQSSLYGYYLLNDLTLETVHLAKQTFKLPDRTEEILEPLREKIKQVRSEEQCHRYLLELMERFWQWRSEATGKYGDLIRKVKGYIEEHYANDQLSLQDAAEHAAVSPSHLSKIFSQETGQTFIEFLTRTRIEKAMELLQNTRAKTYEIAFSVGYHDPHYFSGLFKKTTGMTPKEFRRLGVSYFRQTGGTSRESQGPFA